jgi:hypothetical protein
MDQIEPNCVKDEVWNSTMSVNYPWSCNKIEFWKTRRGEIETKFRVDILVQDDHETDTRLLFHGLQWNVVDDARYILEGTR